MNYGSQNFSGFSCQIPLTDSVSTRNNDNNQFQFNDTDSLTSNQSFFTPRNAEGISVDVPLSRSSLPCTLPIGIASNYAAGSSSVPSSSCTSYPAMILIPSQRTHELYQPPSLNHSTTNLSVYSSPLSPTSSPNILDFALPIGTGSISMSNPTSPSILTIFPLVNSPSVSSMSQQPQQHGSLVKSPTGIILPQDYFDSNSILNSGFTSNIDYPSQVQQPQQRQQSQAQTPNLLNIDTQSCRLVDYGSVDSQLTQLVHQQQQQQHQQQTIPFQPTSSSSQQQQSNWIPSPMLLQSEVSPSKREQTFGDVPLERQQQQLHAMSPPVTPPAPASKTVEKLDLFSMSSHLVSSPSEGYLNLAESFSINPSVSSDSLSQLQFLQQNQQYQQQQQQQYQQSSGSQVYSPQQQQQQQQQQAPQSPRFQSKKERKQWQKQMYGDTRKSRLRKQKKEYEATPADLKRAVKQFETLKLPISMKEDKEILSLIEQLKESFSTGNRLIAEEDGFFDEFASMIRVEDSKKKSPNSPTGDKSTHTKQKIIS